jgi:hypothetical protein
MESGADIIAVTGVVVVRIAVVVHIAEIDSRVSMITLQTVRLSYLCRTGVAVV